MDRRSWPWKKKSSDKPSNADASVNNQAEQDDKVPKYVQITPETYAHLTQSEEQVKVLNEEVNTLNEKLSVAQSEITTKDALVKQHAKVAEEAVSGWEKAEGEASALKLQLETVTLSKLAAEERAAHLDGALKECMKQVRTVKEEGEQKLHDVVFAKTKQWEKLKAEFEAKFVDFEQELIRAGAENDALSRSLEERSNMLMRLGDEKDQAEAEIEVLRSTIQSDEREINSLKYELHVVSKELEIRNEEKNMSVRSADVANKQHQEDVKKISKLEAECQRLRGLVRKKLPGPAALAQMKLEVESLGRDYGDNRLRRSPAKNSSFHHASPPASDFALENIQHFQKENEFLTARLLTMEEETKMLKEALSKRNSELQTSRNMCAKTASKLRSMEVHLLTVSQQKSPSSSNMDIHFDGALSQNGSNPPSLTSMSEDGVDDEGSCSESWATALISELSQIKKEKGGKGRKTENSSQLGLMDDFLEMERLACLSSDTNVARGGVDKMKIENDEATLSGVTVKDEGDKEPQPASRSPETPSSSGQRLPEKFDSPLSKLHSRISSLLDSQLAQNDVGKVLESIRHILKDIEEAPRHSLDSVNANKICPEDMGEVAECGSVLKQDRGWGVGSKHAMDEELRNSISRIHDFVKSLGKEAIEFQDRSSDYHGLCTKIEQFSTSVVKVLSNEDSINDLVVALSHVLSEAGEMKFTVSRDKAHEGETNSLDCIDKVTLLENKVIEHELMKENLGGLCSLLPHSSSDPEFEGPSDARFEVKTAVQLCSPEEYEQLKSEKTNLETELAKCNEIMEGTKLKMVEMEKSLEELRSQLAASEKSNSLAETQLKCMAESYKSLESRKLELEEEIISLQIKIGTLTAELNEERQNHQEDLAKYKDLQEQMERYENEKNLMCTDEEKDTKTKQEKEIAAATERLAECQETILLLGRQLQALRPPESLGSSPNRQRMDDVPGDEAGPIEGRHSQKPSSQFDGEHTLANAMLNMGGESPLNGYLTHTSPLDAEASPYLNSPNTSKRPKHRSRSTSSSTFPIQMPEKQGRGFSRFFSKGKSEN